MDLASSVKTLFGDLLFQVASLQAELASCRAELQKLQEQTLSSHEES